MFLGIINIYILNYLIKYKYYNTYFIYMDSEITKSDIDKELIYISEIDANIDKSISQTINTFNNKNIKTLGCCSGVFQDHYNIDSLKEKISYKNCNNILMEPFIHTKAVFHQKINDYTYKYSKEYYDILRECKGININYNDEQYRITINLDYVHSDELGEDMSIYFFYINKPQLIQLKNSCDSYSEYDTIIIKVINKLEMIIKDYT